MTLGLVARADQRGIGIMTAEFYKHMKPDKVMVIDHGQWPQDFPQYAVNGNFCEANVLNLNDLSLNEFGCRKFLEGLDVVYCVETLYDWRFKQWAEEAGCKVVIHGMPELYATTDHQRGRPQPDEWLWPTPWLLDDGVIPQGYILPVPMPERPNTAAPADDPVLRIVHIAGIRAAGDRNGTVEFIEALHWVHVRTHVTICIQDGWLPGTMPGVPDNVTYDIVSGGYTDRWDMYAGQHAMILPRRYGGLCLPALEAMATGLTAVLPAVPPNTIWPGRRIAIRGTKGHLAPYGFVPAAIISPQDVAKVIDTLGRDRNQLAYDMGAAKSFARSDSWRALLSEYKRVLS